MSSARRVNLTGYRESLALFKRGDGSSPGADLDPAGKCHEPLYAIRRSGSVGGRWRRGTRHPGPVFRLAGNPHPAPHGSGTSVWSSATWHTRNPRPPRPSWTETWLSERTALLTREKAHTREGNAIAAARRRLPMTEVDAAAVLVGSDGPTPLLDVFEGRNQLVVYKHMWHLGKPIADQCEGCTLSIWNVQDTSYLEARDVSFAVFCEGPWDEVAPFVEFMGYTVPWYSIHGVDDPAVGAGLLDDRGFIACYLRDGDGSSRTRSPSAASRRSCPC
jgi:Bacterial protein of unknown function (DUF899)